MEVGKRSAPVRPEQIRFISRQGLTTSTSTFQFSFSSSSSLHPQTHASTPRRILRNPSFISSRNFLSKLRSRSEDDPSQHDPSSRGRSAPGSVACLAVDGLLPHRLATMTVRTIINTYPIGSVATSFSLSILRPAIAPTFVMRDGISTISGPHASICGMAPWRFLWLCGAVRRRVPAIQALAPLPSTRYVVRKSLVLICASHVICSFVFEKHFCGNTIANERKLVREQYRNMSQDQRHNVTDR